MRSGMNGGGASQSASTEKLPGALADTTTSTSINSRTRSSGLLDASKAACRGAKERLENAVRHGVFHKPVGPSRDGRRIALRVPGEGKERGDEEGARRAATAVDEPLIDERRGHAFVSNAIRTSRYTLWDFFPKQLWFQFSRLSNFYFLCVGIPQTIPGISTTGNFTTILPLLIFNFIVILKEGYDDYKRHRLDKVENARGVRVLRRAGGAQDMRPNKLSAIRSLTLRFRPGRDGGQSKGLGRSEPAGDGLEWRAVQWKDVQVGDVVRLSRDDDVPADLALLYAQSEEHVAYVETMALDGETSLKSKIVPADLRGFDAVADILGCGAEFVVEDPNPDLYRFDGRVTVAGHASPLTTNEVLYRGSTLRNTPAAVGLVINTGEECKIRMNANRHPRAKKPALEKVTNGIVLSLVAYVASLTAGCSIGYLLWQRWTEDRSWYLIGAGVAVQEIVVGYAIHFNNLIPLSLYVTLEITKLFQALMLNGDIEMYDEESDAPARCNTNTILENLGQVGYIFSDKTGTLTENVMKLRKVSISGIPWLHVADMSAEASTSGADVHTEMTSALPSPSVQTAPARTVRLDGRTSTDPGRRSMAIPEETELAMSQSPAHGPTIQITDHETPMSPNANRRSSSQWRSTGRPDHVQPEMTTEDLVEYIRARPNTTFSKAATDYLLAVALCHTCLPEPKDGKIEYQAASPDELALVRAAQELGFIVVQRSSQTITLRIADTGQDESNPPRDQVFEILDVIEFSSKRKRMSIVVRCPDGRLLLVCKGADSAILPRLKMAHLAAQKAQEVRQSADLERELLRRSEQVESRASFGGRASLTLRRSIGGAYAEGSSSSSKRPVDISRSKSFEAGTRIRGSADLIRPALKVRTVSFDVPQSSKAARLGAGLKSPTISVTEHVPASPTIAERFAFLEDASTGDPSTVFTRCFKHLDDFASEGLRTLLYSQRFLSEAEYTSWRELYRDASTSLTDRQEKIESVGDSIERDLDLVGASAIEDKLQRGVPETIDRLRRAGIHIWMLTGDKRETAINVAHAARICKPHSDVFIIDTEKGDVRGQLMGVVEELREHAQEAALNDVDLVGGTGKQHGGGSGHHTVLVIDGHTLSEVEQSPLLAELFFGVAARVDSVICCRASPAQKALLVRAVRRMRDCPTAAAPSGATAASGDGERKSLFARLQRRVGLARRPRRPALTLSIGDGGNDLAMLSEAHVGVGISGKEGLQAARVADYSIAQFRFLARLLLVHGRWNYARTARFVLATFWKEMFFYTGTIAFQYFVGYTGTSLYEMWSLTALNTLFTSLCVISPALWEQELAPATLLAVPELYVFGQRGLGLNVRKYLAWMVAGVAEGLFVFFGCWASAGVFGLTGDVGLYAVGNLVFSVAMMWTNWKLLLIDTHHKNAVIFGSFFVTTAGWWAWQAFLSAIYAPPPSPYAVRGGMTEGFGQDLSWWVCLIVMTAALVVVEMAYKAVKRQLVVTGVWSRIMTMMSLGGGGYGRGDLAELEVELWQELEQDPEIRARLEKMSRLVDDGDELCGPVDDDDGGDVDDLPRGAV